MHDFHSKTSTVEDICPSVDHFTLRLHNGLVEVETIEVECHGANTKSSEPDTNNRFAVRRSAGIGIVEGCILEDESSKVSHVQQQCCRSLLLVQTCNHSSGTQFLWFHEPNDEEVTRLPCIAENRDPPNTPATPSMWNLMHKDIVFCLEYKHIVKSTRDTKRHSIGETTLTERINKEYCRCCCYRSRISNTDPGTYPVCKTVPTHDPCRQRRQ